MILFRLRFRSDIATSWLLYFVIICIHGGSSRTHGRATDPGGGGEGAGYMGVNKDAAIERLSQVFDLEKVPVHHHSRSPPQYMRELYDSIADHDGVSMTRGPYGADVVRGLPDRESRHKTMFFFNVSYVRPFEKVLEAEFHLFKLRPRLPSDAAIPRNLHVIELRLYQVVDPAAQLPGAGSRLLEYRRISAHTHGWIVFKVKSTVQTWVDDRHTNHGFLVTATTRKGVPVNGTYVRFAQRSEHHDSKQPVLVVFTENDLALRRLYSQPEETGMMDDPQPGSSQRDGPTQRSDVNTYIQFLNEGFREEYANQARQLETVPDDSPNTWYWDTDVAMPRDEGTGRAKRSKRSKRTMDYYHFPKKRKQTCSKHELYVDFDEIGWSGWIISPKGYNAYHCKGECPFPLGQNQRPTNHATVQSIVHALRIGKDVGTPCCVPNKLYSISLLYFDDDENVILKQYDDMVAASCGCH